MPDVQNMTEAQYQRFKTMLGSDDPKIAELRPRLQAAVQNYESAYGANLGPVVQPEPKVEVPEMLRRPEETSGPSIDAPATEVPESLRLPEVKEAKPQLPNASGDPAFYADPEYVPESLLERELLPEVWREPSMQAFTQDYMLQNQLKGIPMDERLAAHAVETMDPDLRADLYNKFADRMWMDARAQAEAGKKSISRAKFANVPAWHDALASAGDMARSAVGGFLDMASLGILPKVGEAVVDLQDELPDPLRANRPATTPDEIRAQNPGSDMLGQVGGVLAPMGIPGILGRGASSLVKAGEGRLAARTIKSGIAGALGAGAAEGIEGLAEGKSVDEIGHSVGGVLPYGFFGGMAGELGGTALRKYRQGRLKATADGQGGDIVDLERAGGRNRFMTGPEPPPGAARAMDDALAAGAPRQAADFSSGSGARATVRALSEGQDDLFKRLGEENQRFYATEAAKQGSAVPAFNALKDSLSPRVRSGGEPLPFLKEDVVRLRKHAAEFIGKLGPGKVQIVPDEDLGRVRANPRFGVLDAAEAQAMGLPDKLIPPQGMRLAVDLGELTAEQVDEMLEGLDRITNQAAVSGAKDAAFRGLSRGLRQTRETFGRDWAATKERHSQEIQRLYNQKVAVGLPADANVRPGDLRFEGPVDRAIRGHTKRGARNTREALDELLANDPEALQDVRDAVATEAYQNLTKRIGLGSSGGLLISGIRNAQVRVGDPAFAALGREAPRGTSVMREIKSFIDDLSPQTRQVLSDMATEGVLPSQPMPDIRAAIGEGLRLPGGIAGTRASRFVSEGDSGGEEGPPTEDEWYLRMWQGLQQLASEVTP